MPPFRLRSATILEMAVPAGTPRRWRGLMTNSSTAKSAPLAAK